MSRNALNADALVDALNVYPETEPYIEHARCLPDRRREDRISPVPNIGRLLERRATEAPNSNWLTFQDDRGEIRRSTYGEFYSGARRIAAVLQERFDIRTGDRVATLMHNDPCTVLIYFGTWLLGATVVPINSGEDDERIAYILANSGAKALFALPEQAARVAPSAEQFPALRTIVQVGGVTVPGCIDFETVYAGQAPLPAPPDVALETECLIIYTSGTTGAPKGVTLDQYNLLADSHSIAEWHRFGPDDRSMLVLPIHHVNGIVVTLLTPLYCGGSVVLNRRFRAQTFWQTVAEEGCTFASVVPTVLAFLCERNDDLTAWELSRFRHIVCGAGPLTVELARRFHRTFGIRVVHGYGLSETTCYSCFLPVDLDRAAYEHWMFDCGFPSIGCPISANVMAIHDASGHPLPEEARGEIVIRGHNVMCHYFARPEANRDTFAHGWFRSGDEGFYRTGPDGRAYFFITGRIKELIIRGGINYSPFDIDEVLNAVPGVKAAMAVGFENDFYGEEIGAYVQRAEGATLTEEELLRACRESLPFSKCPKVVLFGETFPVTSTGKYQRNRLKPLFARWKETQFREGGAS